MASLTGGIGPMPQVCKDQSGFDLEEVHRMRGIAVRNIERIAV